MPRQSHFKPGFAKGFGAGLGIVAGTAGVMAIFGLIFTLILAGIGSLIADNIDEDTGSHARIAGSASASHTLFAVNISGTIMTSGGSSFTTATYGYEIAQQLDDLSADDADGVIMFMDTPGGTITGARAIADAVVRYQERTGHKVMAYVQSQSASGGMYAMAPADEIVSDYGTLIGSIGVIMGPLSQYHDVTAITGNILSSGVETSGGITSEYFTQGRGKDFGNPWRDITQEERDVYNNNLAVEYADFVDFVSTHRGIPTSTIIDTLGAYMFDPQTALNYGLIDQVMNRNDALAHAAEMNGLDPADTKVITPSEPGLFSSLLGAESRVWGHNVPLSTNDGMSASSEICNGAPSVLAYHGSLTGVCEP